MGKFLNNIIKVLIIVMLMTPLTICSLGFLGATLDGHNERIEQQGGVQ